MNTLSYARHLSIAATVMITALSMSTYAHDGEHPDAPNPSPMASTSQVVGYGNVSVTYGRPGVKDRTIWGELVPYDGGTPRPWVAGANGSTIITFDEDVTVNGQPLKAGAYGFFIIPDKEEWTLIFSNNNSKYGIMKYNAEEDALRITVKPESAEHEEWLDYEFEKTGELTGTLNLHWEKVKAGFVIEAPDHRKK